MRSVAMLAARAPLARSVAEALGRLGIELRGPIHPDLSLAENRLDPLRGRDAVLYLPSARLPPHAGPDLAEARRVFALCKEAAVPHLVVVSSAEAYGPSPRNPGLIAETRPTQRDAKNAISLAWLELEAAAREAIAAPRTLTVLRRCPVLVPGGGDFFSRLFSGRVAITLAGHDPSLQLLHPDDLARAIACALERSRGGLYNIAPDDVIPLRFALELADSARLPLPREAQLHARRFLSAIGLSDPIDQLDYLRYSFTVSTAKCKHELGFQPRHVSAQAIAYLLGADEDAAGQAAAESAHDPFGLDKDYIATGGRMVFDFMARRYWRIEVEGLEHVPAEGPGVLVGQHRGLVAWDGVMILHLLAERMHRYPRFLVHPTGFQFPFVFDFATKMGGVLACQENADYVLSHGQLLGIFPEGIRGVFSLYREAYQLRKFGRHDFVKIAIRHGAPIIPFVIAGSAETYPILGKIEWSWLKRKTEWPFFPITPTLFPLMPAPLPVKWVVRFLPPFDVKGHPPEAAKNSALVRSISDRVKHEMQTAIDELVRRRKSAFLG